MNDKQEASGASQLFKTLADIIPKIRTPFQLLAFALCALLLLLQFSRGLNTFVITLAICTIILLFIASAIASRIEAAKQEGTQLTIYYCVLILVIIIALFLGFYTQVMSEKPGELSWAGGHLKTYTQVLNEHEHVHVALSQELNDVIICKGLSKFHGQTAYEILQDIAWRNKDCLSINRVDPDDITVSVGSNKFVLSREKNCHECKPS